MALTKEQILTEALSLAPQEREELAEAIWLSIDGLTREEIDAAWVAECQRRLDAVDRGEMELVPGEQVIRELRERLRK